MKALFKLIVAVPVVVLSALSCNKETEPETATDTSRISISVMAEIDNLPACGDTKASIAPVMRLSWANGDKVFVYDGSKCLGTLTVSLQDNDARYAKLDGNIESTQSSVLTCVYAGGITENPVLAGNTVTFPMAEQAPDKTPFVVYGTMPYEGTAAISDKIVNFQFATSVVLVNCLNLAATGAVTMTELSGINTNCVLTLSGSGAPAVRGSVEGTITTTGTFSSGNGKLSYYIGVPVSGKVDSSRGLTVYQGDDKYITTFTTAAFAAGSFKNVLYSFAKENEGGDEEDQGPEFGVDPDDYVEINGIYWAKNNLAVTDSGKRAWRNSSNSTVTVPGEDYPVINGDYFQWGASYDGYGLTGDKAKPENLVPYTEFLKNSMLMKGPSETFGSKYKPNISYANGSRLSSSDDTANLCLGDGWRLPTSDEWKGMKDATYWAFDSTDGGLYVFKPTGSYKAGGWSKTFPTALDKGNAILFFPAASYASGEGVQNYLLQNCEYWSSSMGSSNPYSTQVTGSMTTPKAGDFSSRQIYIGLSIRPVKSVSE